MVSNLPRRREIDRIFNHSRARCEKEDRFLDRFYEKFTATSPEISEKFANTDFTRQKQALALSLKMISLASKGGDEADLYLGYIATRHDRHHLNIKPELYDFWVDTLIDTVRETDSQYDDDVERAWRSTLAYGIDYMKSHY